jgi:hypothetical protein
VHKNLAAWEGGITPPTVSYEANFDAKAVGVAVNEVVQFSSVPIIRDCKKAQAALVKPIVRRIMVESGDDDSDIEEVMSDIDEKAEEPEIEPAAGSVMVENDQVLTDEA